MSGGLRGTERPNLTLETNFSGTNGKKGKSSFSLFSGPRPGLATIPIDTQSAIYDGHE